MKKKPQLNLDGLFGLDNQDNPSGVIPVNLEKFSPFEKHPFRLYEGERLNDMVESIRTNGVLVPVIARNLKKENENVLELLAGHNRLNAARLSGLTEIPAIILDNISDEAAMVYVVETNLIQRSFADMVHSEKATVIGLHYSKMFSQGKRNDIQEQLEYLEKAQRTINEKTSPQLGEKFLSGKKVGEIYSLSKNTVSRYLRINHLIPELKNLLDIGELKFIPAVTLSFLSNEEQQMLVASLRTLKKHISIKIADRLREESVINGLDPTTVTQILNGETETEVVAAPAIRISKNTFSRFFPEGITSKDLKDVIEKALKVYFLHPEFQKSVMEGDEINV